MEKVSVKKIKKLPSKLTTNDMYNVRMVYFIPPHVDLVIIPQYLLEMDDLPQDWYVLHHEALHIGLRFPIPLLVTRFLNTYDLILA